MLKNIKNKNSFFKFLAAAFLVVVFCPSLSQSEVDSFLPKANRWIHVTPTTPSNNSKDNFSFFAIGDMGTGWKSQYQLVERMDLLVQKNKKNQPDSVLLLGDIIYPSPSSEELIREKFAKPFKALLDKGLRFYPAWGNHDWASEKAALLKKYFVAPNYYTFINGPVQLWAVNSNNFNTEQAQWLEDSLRLSQSPWKIVFLHHSPYSSGKFHHNNKNLVKNLSPILDKYKVDLCLSGHNHLYERSGKIGSTIYITSGGGSASLHKYDEQANFPRQKVSAQHHFLLIQGNKKRLDLKAIDLKGSVIDQKSLTKNI